MHCGQMGRSQRSHARARGGAGVAVAGAYGGVGHGRRPYRGAATPQRSRPTAMGPDLLDSARNARLLLELLDLASVRPWSGSPTRTGPASTRPRCSLPAATTCSTARSTPSSRPRSTPAPPGRWWWSARGRGQDRGAHRVADLAAERFGWLTVHVEVRPHEPFTDLLAGRLLEAAAVLTDAPPGPRFAVDTATVRARLAGVGAEPAIYAAAPPEPVRHASLGDALHRAVDAALARESGLVLTVDEVQLAFAPRAGRLRSHPPGAHARRLAARRRPRGPAIGAQPRRSVAYLERAAWYEIGLLDERDTARALAEPAAQAGRPLYPPRSTCSRRRRAATPSPSRSSGTTPGGSRSAPPRSPSTTPGPRCPVPTPTWPRGLSRAH